MLGYLDALGRGVVVLASLHVVAFVARQAHVLGGAAELGRELEASERDPANRI